MGNSQHYQRTQISVDDTPSSDAFGRLRTSTPANIFDNINLNDKQPLVWDEALDGGGTATFLPDESAIRLDVGTLSGDRVIRQTKQYFKYQPGKSFLANFTATIGEGKANVRKRIGYFDEDNGLFFEQLGTEFRVVRRFSTSGSVEEEIVPQQRWNIDRLDGSGASGVTLDISQIQIFLLDFQWLGAGRVRMGVDVDGRVIYVHEFTTSNKQETVYLTRPNFPIRLELENTGTSASASSFQQYCVSISSEGGFTPLGQLRAVDNGVSAITVDTALTPLLSIRLKSGNIRSTAIPKGVQVLSTAGDDLNYHILFNPTLTGAVWNSVDDNSVMEFDTSATDVVSGTVIFTGYQGGGGAPSPNFDAGFSAGTDNLISDLVIAANISGVSDIITVAGRVFTGTSPLVSTMFWKELI